MHLQRSAALLLAALPLAAAGAQTAPSITFYELPAFLGRSVTVTADTFDLAAQGFAKRAQSARVVGTWQVCPQAAFAGTCQTLSADAPLLRKSAIVSVKAPAAAAATGTTAATAATPAATSGGLDIASLDAGAGTEGQDVTFFAQPTLGGKGVSAGTNDSAAANAFCKEAGFSSASYAGRARAQSSGLVDIAAKASVRGYPLRDVLCRR